MMKNFVALSLIAFSFTQVSYAATSSKVDRKIAQFGAVKGTMDYRGPVLICEGGVCKSGNWAGTIDLWGPAAATIYKQLAVTADKTSGEKVGSGTICNPTSDTPVQYHCTIQFDDVREGTVHVNSGYTPSAKPANPAAPATGAPETPEN